MNSFISFLLFLTSTFLLSLPPSSPISLNSYARLIQHTCKSIAADDRSVTFRDCYTTLNGIADVRTQMGSADLKPLVLRVISSVKSRAVDAGSDALEDGGGLNKKCADVYNGAVPPIDRAADHVDEEEYAEAAAALRKLPSPDRKCRRVLRRQGRDYIGLVKIALGIIDLLK